MFKSIHKLFLDVKKKTSGEWEGVSFPRKNHYEGVQFNVISVMRGWVVLNIQEKKRYVTLEWPPTLQAQ